MRTLVRAAAGSSTAQAFASDKEELQRRLRKEDCLQAFLYVPLPATLSAC